MNRKIVAVLAALLASTLAARAQNPPAAPGQAKPGDAAAASPTNKEAHEFLASKVDKVMYSLSGQGVKTAILTTEMNMTMGPMGDIALKTKYVWQADPPKDKFTLTDDGKLSGPMAMMKGAMEESFREQSRKMILAPSVRWKDAQLTLTKADDGTIGIALPERAMGPVKIQETWFFSADGKLLRTETKANNPAVPATTSTPTLKEVGGKFLVVSTEDKSPMGSGKSEIKFEEKDGLQLPVEVKSSSPQGERSVKISVTPNAKLTDADFADAPAAPKDGEKKGL